MLGFSGFCYRSRAHGPDGVLKRFGAQQLLGSWLPKVLHLEPSGSGGSEACRSTLLPRITSDVL